MSEPRLLAVHAHADDETITMGATMATLADAGGRVGNVCCTDGELATIVAKDMPEAEFRPRLADIRRAELRRACEILGVAEVHFLGYHDSGMAGADTNRRAEAFWMQPIDEVAGRLVERIREFRPHVIVTYDAYGGYGHPDHIQAHRATLVAVEAAARESVYPECGEPWSVSKLYYVHPLPVSAARRAVAAAEAAGMAHPFDGRPVEELEFVTRDEVITTSLDVRAGLGRKREALLAHHSQIDESFPMVSLPPEVMSTLFGHEYYQLALSRVPVSPPETDLFAGVAIAP